MLFRPVTVRFFSKSTKFEKFFQVKKEQTIPQIFPKQHPKNIESRNNEIIKLEKPPVYLTPELEVPFDLYKPPTSLFECPEHSKALDIALIGPTNAGKSSLMNRLIEGNVSAVSNKANTTDEALKGVYTNIEKRTQLVFYDTPGIIKRYKHTKHFVTTAWETLEICDKAIFVVDSVKRADDSIKEALQRLKRLNLGEGHLRKLKKLKQEENNPDISSELLEELQRPDPNDKLGDQTIPTYLVLNKIDLCTNKRKLKWLVSELEDIARFEKIFFTSAETGYGIKDIIETLEEEAYARPWEFNPNHKADVGEVDLIQQAMKTFVYERFYHEIPHQVGIELIEFRMRSDGVLKLGFTLEVDHAAQVAMVIGEKGRNLKYLRERMENELAHRYQKRSFVNIQVKKRVNKREVTSERINPIIPPNYSVEKTKQKLEMLKRRELPVLEAMK